MRTFLLIASASVIALSAPACKGEIDPYISHALPLAHAVDAMRLLENREVIGKAVVTMNGYTP